MSYLNGEKILFASDNISIEFCSERYSRTSILEAGSSFTLLFLLGSDIYLEKSVCLLPMVFRKNQYILYYSSEENKAELRCDSQEALKYLLIRIDYQYIVNLINPQSSQESTDILENMIANNFIYLRKETLPSMTVEMHMILKEIIDSSKKGVIQKLFIEAKIIKLLILVFEQFHEKNRGPSKPGTPEMIKKYLDENYHSNIKAEEIGKLLGINQNIIRQEFKTQYHMTISHYISELRMLKAKKLITNSDVMIKEIAIECGYEYVQNFTRAFKKKFGVAPENLRNNK
ncbi:AraC family transcriptional regulator [Chryseobacterium sp. Bi04]|uniref:helix-turn-helix transcriptional regulator n=1 Tax=Chryseobacterium sp. Bi04 TaxID=2822345 RepID=UPI001D8CAD05|nr:AraC family transcriptional regulator [Chryseobacterium sp. Bi04]CAH0127142.1 Virulence regulon transcriptional activator VirF [Chryseobacterium sp. Bi04]